ncbi:MAG: hypothetical protein IIY20_05240, partial [Bifidobacteriaceae bacterium]|nr:hypothetical protein [Bifidobacteriaceae bacterium]
KQSGTARRETVRTNTGKETQTQTGKETAGKRPGNRIKRAKRQTVFARAKNSSELRSAVIVCPGAKRARRGNVVESCTGRIFVLKVLL